MAVGAILVCGGLILAQELAGTGATSAGTVSVMWLALPFANALAEYLSLGASHWLGRRLLSSGKSPLFALTLGLADLAIAAVLMLVTVKVIGVGLALTDRAIAGDIDGTGFLSASLADLWGTGLWLGLMVLRHPPQRASPTRARWVRSTWERHWRCRAASSCSGPHGLG